MKSMPGASGPRTEWVDVTPDIAREWLLFVDEGHQRSLSQQTVNKYTVIMRAGEWRLTAEPITFDINNCLIQGRHRLAALVAAGVTLRFLVVRGAPSESFAVIDVGRARTAAQFMKGSYQHTTVAAARILWAVENNLPSPDHFKTWKSWPLDKQIDYVDSWKELNLWAGEASAAGRASRIGGKFLLATVAQAARTEYAERIPLFLEGVRYGQATDWKPIGDPRALLKQKFDSIRAPSYNSLVQLTDVGYSVVVKAWNLYALEQDANNNSLTVKYDRDRRAVVVGSNIDFRKSPILMPYRRSAANGADGGSSLGA